jgi:hypothetical protein
MSDTFMVSGEPGPEELSTEDAWKEIQRLRAENKKLRADLNHEEVFNEKVGEANKRLKRRGDHLLAMSEGYRTANARLRDENKWLKVELREWAEVAGKLQTQTNPGDEWCATCGEDLISPICSGCHGCSDQDCLPIDCGDCLCGEGK